MGKRFNLAEFVQAEAVSDLDTMEITMIEPARIRMNPRNFYEPEDVGDLVDSITMNGLMDPIVVYKGAGILYTILSGHRRYRAITIIRGQKGHEHDFDRVPCIVRPAPADTAREDIMLIQANSTGRIRTPNDMAEEARRLTAAFVQLKKDGAELPGRVRDMVADAMGMSKSKVARIQAIEKNLKVPGFKTAYKDQKLPEAVAYEISQLTDQQQYDLLDHAIDDGLAYERLTIKDVQKLRRRIEAGESTKQDLHVLAEKRGIKISGEDFSPLLAELVAEAIPESWQKGLSTCRSKAEALEHLHRFGFQHCSSWGGAVSYDSDPQALVLRQPICRRIKWAEVWELLALRGLQQTHEPAAVLTPNPEVKLKTPAGGASPAPTGEIFPAWKSGTPTREGRYMCKAEIDKGRTDEYTSCEWKEGRWWIFDRPAFNGFKVVGWWPLPDKEEDSDG